MRGAAADARPAAPPDRRRDSRRGIRVAIFNDMLPDPEFNEDLPEGAVDFSEDAEVHRFTVQRGMAVALVIETRDWYSGLVQAAMARVRIEGQN
jgi:hypothetical protein